MKLTVIGTGYVGLVTGACLADVGNDVLCLDLDVRKIEKLNSGGIPIHEPGLSEIVNRNRAAGRLGFTLNTEQAVAHGEIQFIAVGTPPDEDGSADLRYVMQAARNVGRYMDGYKNIVDKSTVPVGTADQVTAAVKEELERRGSCVGFDVVSNPEFLKEGAAVADFMRPDRIVVGATSEKAIEAMRELYAPFQRNHERMVVMDVRSAELTKYAANAMLATRISFMNEIARLAERIGADIDKVRNGIGLDPRIGSHFLYAGCGYGGSCFPKDVKAIIRSGESVGEEMPLLRSVEEVNERQKKVIANKILDVFRGDIAGKSFAVWGLAFKPDTDDMREAPSLVVINLLLSQGATVRLYDPIASGEAKHILGEQPGITYASSALDAAEAADALVILTEWKEFRSPDFAEVKRVLRNPYIFDGRNLYTPSQMAARGFHYYGIGRPFDRPAPE